MQTSLPVSEMLESRTLLSSVSVAQTVLTINGDAKTANNISVHRSADNEITVSVNGSQRVFGSCDVISRIVINGGNLADRLVVNEEDRPLGIAVSMNGGGGDDTLIGGAGNDTLMGQDGDDSIDGNGGNDVLQGSSGNDTLHGNAGSDSIWGNDGKDSVSGDDGNDVLFGGKNGDTMFGGNGNDTFRGGDPRDKMDGGAGKNRFLKK